MPDSQGGMQECIRQLCLQTKQYGVQNTVLTVSPNVSRVEELQRPECHLVRFPQSFDVASTSFSVRMMKGYAEAVQDSDLIHYHFPWPVADVMHYVHNIDKPYIVTYQSDIVKQRFLKVLYAPLMKKFLTGAQCITVASPNYLSSSPVLVQFKDKCQVMPLGLDENSYPVNVKKQINYWTDKLGKEPFFLFVGALRYYKGLQFLIQALEGTNYKLVLAGIGPMEAMLKKEVHSRNLQSQVLFTGFLEEEDKVALLQLCHAFVFPSHLRSEAFGISLLEAAMFGKPLISCEIGTGTTFINQDKKTGLVVRPERPDELRDAMCFLMDVRHTEVVKQMGKAARKRFEEVFTAQGMGKTCFRIYQEVLGY